ncbi:TPA: hypothetical protein QDZ66_000643 [Pluralibacter gergoviae]|uniref:hypothetical protein n=1 Tax=Pluralibacter gergoviae TaxID=61647 RepID=UPI00069F05B0|nr:hypothetical protein [Pluralibacter gergoviae]MBL3694265.1 hypothetical protein [Pluralibacter gergoviae]HDS1149928.1 hypothetical protein [Pluralibacter gergoviae]
MTIKFRLLIAGAVLGLQVTIFYAGYLRGWYAHSEQTNRVAAKKSKKTEKAIVASEKKAATAATEGRVVYRTIYRDVVKYVNNPDRTLCQFDSDAVQLRQRALDAANTISGFDAGAVPGSQPGGNK